MATSDFLSLTFKLHALSAGYFIHAGYLSVQGGASEGSPALNAYGLPASSSPFRDTSREYLTRLLYPPFRGSAPGAELFRIDDQVFRLGAVRGEVYLLGYFGNVAHAAVAQLYPDVVFLGTVHMVVDAPYGKEVM